MKWFSNLLFFLLPLHGFASTHLEVFVWDPGVNDPYGHVALNTPKHYISLMPITPDSSFQIQYDGPITTWQSRDIERVYLQNVGCIKARAINIRDFQTDKVVRGRGGGERKADSIYYIKVSLAQKEAVEAEWERLAQQHLIWFSLGTYLNKDIVENHLREQEQLRSLVLSLYKNPLAFNCASLVYHLLRVSGLDLNNYTVGSIYDSWKLRKILTGLFDLSFDQNALDAKIIYPSKIGYMAKHRMVDLIKIELNYVNLKLNDNQVDHIFRMVRGLGEPNEQIRNYLKVVWDNTMLGKLDINCNLQ